MKIYLLRHGETDWSKEGRLSGHTDIPLNETGIEQVKVAGEYFSLSDENIDVIISSPLVRARKSAEIIADKIGYPIENIIIEQGFIERCFGLGESLTKEERNIKYPNKAYPNIEHVEDLCERAGTTIAKYVKEYSNKTLLITAHSSILKAVLTSVTNGNYPYSEGSSVFGTGKFCLLDYNGENYEIISHESLRKK